MVSFLNLQKEQRITSNKTASRLRVPNLKESLVSIEINPRECHEGNAVN
jgi:hypothetical protein